MIHKDQNWKGKAIENFILAGLKGGLNMIHLRAWLKAFFAIFLIIVFVSLSTDCTTTTNTTFELLKSYINTIKVVNTHEHQRQFSQYEGQAYNFYTLLAHSYLQADLISAGAPRFKPEIINRGDLDTLWDAYGPFLDFSRNTSYYSHFLSGFWILYGYDESCFTKEGIQSLSEKIAENYGHREEWYQEAFQTAGFEIMFVDQYWDAYNTELDNRYFALVFNINPLVSAISNRPRLTEKEAPERQNIYKLAEKKGSPIQSLEDYLLFADHLFQKFKDRNVVCLKNSQAYGRSLEYEHVSFQDAKILFDRRHPPLFDDEKKALEDFMFHWIIEKSIELDLPIQIHTGYLAGNRNVLENGRPTKLNNLFLRYPKAKFVLFHGGYPWTGEFTAFGKMFPNVHLDLVWLPQISREAAVRGLDEMLDCVPYNKFFWGGDCHFIEESTGSLEFGKDVVAQVLAMRVERGLMTDEVALDVAHKIFRENAIQFFKLQEKLNLSD